jgi:hypothetical protein
LSTAASAEPKGASDTTLPGMISADERRAAADDSRAPRTNGNVYIASSSCTFSPTAAVRMRLLPALPLLGLAPPPPLLLLRVLLCPYEVENALVLSQAVEVRRTFWVQDKSEVKVKYRSDDVSTQKLERYTHDFVMVHPHTRTSPYQTQCGRRKMLRHTGSL